MKQPALRTWEKDRHYEWFQTDKHLAFLYVKSGKYDVTVLTVDNDTPCTFGNSFDTEAEAKAWVENLQDES